jgi:cytochrome P450
MSCDKQTSSSRTPINLFDPAVLVDPWHAYQVLRDEAPVQFMPAGQVHVVTRYDLVMQVLRDSQTYSSQYGPFIDETRQHWLSGASPSVREQYLKIASQMLAPLDTLLTADPPTHKKYRSKVDKIFTATKVRHMEPHIQQVIDEAIDGFIEKGQVDFMQAFALPVPLRIISDRLGVPPKDRPFFYDGATVAASSFRLTTYCDDELLRRAQVMVDLQNYMVDLVQARRKDPADDMCSVLGEVWLDDEQRPLNPAELWSILNQFLVAGHETTASTFGWAMLLLCQSPELQAQLLDDPHAVRTFCEEALRLESPVQGLPRLVTKDTELGGYPLKAGAMLMLRYGAANRDERHFECPAQVNLQRKNAGSQLAFGSGIHHCVGAPLARQELNLGVSSLLSRMKHFRLTPGHEEPKAEPSVILRSLPALNVQFDRR